MREETLLKQMLDIMYEGIYLVDKERKLTFWNRGAELITGFSAKEVVGSHCYDNILNHVDDAGNQLCFAGCPLEKTLQDEENRETRVYLHHKDGHRVPVKVKVTPLYDDSNELVGAVEIFVDDSHVFGRDLTDAELRAIAFTDDLTSLPNRRSVDSLLRLKQAEMVSLGMTYAIAFIDIDHFKRVNDTYGHDGGDEVLKMVAQTLKHATRSIDFVGRWGGEEFIMVFQGVDQGALKNILEKVRMLVEQSALRREDDTINVTISIGGALASPEFTIDKLVQKADHNMYQSKENGRNQVTI